jgi:protein-S-isoprenylcysteine O-methyltransferase Ste14
MIKKLLQAVVEAGKSAAIDGTLKASDIKNNKKKVAFSLAKSVAWTLVQNHPAYIMLRLAIWGIVILAALIAVGIVAYIVW